VTLDGSASCDADGDALQAHWELVSAPSGSAWSLSDADTMHPKLLADRVGPYRARLTVTDSHGATSLEQEVLIIAGPRCGDGIDDDLDGRIDTDDADCDGTDPIDPGSDQVAVGTAAVVEGDAGKARSVQIPVTLSRPSTSPVTVPYTIEADGSSTAAAVGTDFKAKSGVLTFTPNAKTGLTPTTKFVSASVFPDTDTEGDETFRVVLGTPSAGYTTRSNVAAVRILDDEGEAAPRVSIGDATIVEGDSGTTPTATNAAKVRITLDRPATGTVSVVATISPGSATAGVDYKATKPKVITFKPGQWQKTITLKVLPDTTTGEGVETAFVNLASPTGAALARAFGLVSIVDDDD
jgi:hypothetical protein